MRLLLRKLDANNGFLDDTDEMLALYSTEVRLAERRGLVYSGSAWDDCVTITDRGDAFLAHQ